MGAIDMITTNLTVSIEMIIALLVLMGGFIFYAKDFKLGVSLHFFAFTLNFLSFWALNEYYSKTLNISPSLVFMLLFLVIMAFSLFAVEKNAPEGRFT